MGNKTGAHQSVSVSARINTQNDIDTLDDLEVYCHRMSLRMMVQTKGNYILVVFIGEEQQLIELKEYLSGIHPNVKWEGGKDEHKQS